MRGGIPQHMERAAGGARDAGLQPSDATEPAGLGGMQGGIVVPLCVGHPVHVHGALSRSATACHASLYLHFSTCGKQGNDCYTPSFTARKCAMRNEKLAVSQEACGFCQGWTKTGLGPSTPTTGSQFCLSFA